MGTRTAPAITAQQLIQLALAATAMVAVASVQEAWSLFVTPLQQRLGGGPVALVQVQSAFSVFIVVQTIAVPLSGIIADRHAPTMTLVPAALLFGGGWWISARADTLATLSISIGICAVGVGTVYSTCTAHAIRWFPHHRGLAAGVTSCGYGAGAGLFLFRLQSSILEHGTRTTTEWWSIALGSVVFLVGMLMTPPPSAAAAHSVSNGQMLMPARIEREVPPVVVVRQPLFQWCYLAMLLIAMTGLVITAQLKPIAQFYGIADLPVVGTVPVLLVALQVDMIFLGLLRPVWGVLSDKVGRARTMLASFTTQTILAALYWYGVTHCQPGHAALIVALGTGPTFAAYGVSAQLAYPVQGTSDKTIANADNCAMPEQAVFSLMPALIADVFGSKHQAANFGCLYTSKAAASVLAGPLAAWVRAAQGDWAQVLLGLVVASAAATGIIRYKILPYVPN
eukprot:COSAG02_NODE_942_length_15746_cov_6.164632_18_plen_453_part_00